MKVLLEEALEHLERLKKIAVSKMKDGTEKHGEEMVQDPLSELEGELADAFNYITLGFIKAVRGFYEFERKTGVNFRSNKGDWEGY